MWPPEDERFADRVAAGRLLGGEVAEHLKQVLTDDTRAPLVLALPRGGVPVGFEVANAIGADFDIMVTRKIGLPWQPDLHVGAIAEDGPVVYDHNALGGLGLTPSDVSAAVQRERMELLRRRELYRAGRPTPSVAGRTVILVDDGVTTSLVARAAVRAIRAGNPAHLAFAAPVCAAEEVDCLGTEADAVVHIRAPRDFPALGLWYRDHTEFRDSDVAELLGRAWATAPTG